jgi:hypothetical protein
MGVKAISVGSARNGHVNSLTSVSAHRQHSSGLGNPRGCGSRMDVSVVSVESGVAKSGVFSVLGGGWSSPRARGGGSGVRATSIGIFVLSAGRVTARGWQRLGGIDIKAINIRRASGVNSVGISPRDWYNDSWSTTTSSGRIEGV